MDRTSDVATRGQAVVVTAGPPGAGKSSALLRQPYEGYRLIDPDIIKDLVLQDAERRKLLDFRLGRVLSDGRGVALRELATHVHRASTRIADVVRDMALKAGENVIVDGSLSWERLPGQYIDELSRAGYEHLTVVSVEVPLETAYERARSRWWTGRHADEMGGRFVPDHVISAMFSADGSSQCTTNAAKLAERGRDELGAVELIRYEVDSATGDLRLVP
ncbi:zeta toxin family protein [Zafaria sp. Z1313]|uniref:zeta toxin family protein n=1 Tax=Zafaria sp. Z1313 TaxID=3423202 RepID=UPI003D302B48